MILSSLILFRNICKPIVSRNFSRVSRLPEKGVIFPPLALDVPIMMGSFLSGIGVTGVFGSGTVSKLSSVSVCLVDVIHGSGGAGVLHWCSKLNNSKGLGSWMVDYLTILRDRMSSSESLSLLVFKNLVRSGFFPFWDATVTATSCLIR